jgi:hypothetical protein
MSIVDDVGSVGERERVVLFDEHHRQSSLDQLATGRHQVAHDHGRQALERLVEEDDLGVPDERPPQVTLLSLRRF